MITLQNITLYQGALPLIENANYSIYQGQKIGVIGRNGCGKSTFFRLLMGELTLDAGDMLLPQHLDRAQMKQETEASDRSAVDYVIDGDLRFRQLEQDLEEAERTESHIAMAHLFAEMEVMDGFNITNRAEKLLSGLGFSPDDFSKTVREFSGGWRIRLNLAQALMQPSDLLLLDEPTNHLDLEATLWLRQWLLRFEGTVLLISHDRQFLDEVVGHIISFENKKLIGYRGNYSSYEMQKAERMAQQQAVYEKQQLRKGEIEDFVRRFRATASKAKQAQSRLKELQRMVDIEPAHVDSPFYFRFREPAKIPNTLLTCENVSVGYHRKLFSDFSITISNTARIGLLGPNGQGKSTLLKTIVGDLPLLDGKVHYSDHMVMGYCAQEQTDVLDQDASPLLIMRRLDGKASEQELRNFLGSFAFKGEQVDATIRNFSGGEKSRLALALVAWQRPNLLLMDEPTNHLDLEMVHALTRAMQEYVGALILVSHDRHLLNNTVDQFLIIRDGKVEFFDGSLDDYEQLVLAGSGAKAGAAPKSKGERKDTKQQAAQRREQLKPLKDKIKKLEQQLEREEQKMRETEQKLLDPTLYEDSNKTKLAPLLKQQQEMKRQQAVTEEQWLQATTELEALAE
ncbi:MAG: ABC-F family ATP-binding cassette domain-containing protein [Pseudohongiellaceae bacterium]